MAYVIKPGDTLTTIAKANGTTVDAIAKANNITNPNLIVAGSSLTLPTTTPVTTSPVNTTTPVTTTVKTTTPVATTTPPGSSTGLAPSTPNTDYAAAYATAKASGADQSVLDKILADRQTKIDSDTTKYAGVMSNADLVAKYNTPTIKVMVSATANPDGTITITYSDGTTSVQGTPKTLQSNAQIDSLTAMLQNLATTSGTPDFPTLSYDNATTQASNEISPQYKQIMDELMRTTDIDLEKRGIFNSPLASGIVTEKSGQVNASKASDIAKRATELVQSSQDNAYKEKQLYLADKSQRMDALSNLINSLSNRELSEAELTGVLRGVQTLQAQQLAADTAYKNKQIAIQEGNLTGTYNGNPTLEKQIADADKAFKEANLTGVYKNNPTLAGRAQALDEFKTQLDAALSRTEQFGKVTNAADAALLGVPVGSTTQAARDAAASRANQWAIAANSLAEDARQFDKSYNLESQAQQFEQDLKVWQLTGKAPDTPSMKAYGVTPGTDWTDTTLTDAEKYQKELADQQAADDQAFNAKAASYKDYFSNSKFGKAAIIPGMSDATAEAVAMLSTNDDRSTAIAKMNDNADELASEGVDISQLTKAINILYPDIQKAGIPSDADWNNPLYIDPSTNDYRMDMMNQYSQEIQDWLTKTTGYLRSEDGNLASIIPVLNDFYTKFPGGSGNLADKLTFVRTHKDSIFYKIYIGQAK